MKVSRVILTKFLSPLIAASVIVAVYAQPVTAQSAGNVKCNGCVNSKDIKNRSIRTNDIRNNAVNTAKIANGAVNGAKIASDTLTAFHITDEGGADFVEGPALFDLTGGHDLVSTVRVTAPTAGTVIVNASGIFGPTPSNIVECSITTEAVTGGPSAILLWSNAIGALDLIAVPFAGTRGFQVTAGTTDINLVCRDGTGNANVHRVQMSAMFFPTRY